MAIPVILGSILAQAGAPILKSIIDKTIGTKNGAIAGKVIDAISTELSIPATEEAIVEKYNEDPVSTGSAIQAVEENNKAEWLAYLEGANATRAEMIAREDNRESWFAWAWRPAMSWLIIFMFVWSFFIVPVLNATLGYAIPIISPEDITQFAGIWLVIYGGGNTVKTVFGPRGASK